MAKIYYNRKIFDESFKHFQNSFELNPYDFHFSWLYIKSLVEQKKYQQALKISKTAAQKNPYNNWLIDIHQQIDHQLNTNSTPLKVSIDFSLIPSNPNPYKIIETQENLSQIAQMALKKNTLLAFMQYPLRDRKQIKSVLNTDNHPRVTIIGNKNNFQKNVNEKGFEKIFWDRFAGNFGHATKLGQSLIVDNIVNSLHKKWCPAVKDLCLKTN